MKSSYEILANHFGKATGIRVEFGSRACTNGKVIILPKKVPSDAVESMLALLLHESFHIRAKSHKIYEDTETIPESSTHHCVNVLEDVRIDNKVLKTYRHTRDFYLDLFRLLGNKPPENPTDIQSKGYYLCQKILRHEGFDYNKEFEAEFEKTLPQANRVDELFQLSIKSRHTEMLPLAKELEHILFPEHAQKLKQVTVKLKVIRVAIDDNDKEQKAVEGGKKREKGKTKKQLLGELEKKAEKLDDDENIIMVEEKELTDELTKLIEEMLKEATTTGFGVIKDLLDKFKGKRGKESLEPETVELKPAIIKKMLLAKMRTTDKRAELYLKRLPYLYIDPEKLFHQRHKKQRETVLYFILDISGSMGGRNSKTLANCTLSVLQACSKIREVKTEIIVFNDWSTVIKRPKQTVDSQVLYKQLTSAGGNTNIGEALDLALSEINRQQHTHHAVICFTDACITPGDATALPKQAKRFKSFCGIRIDPQDEDDPYPQTKKLFVSIRKTEEIGSALTEAIARIRKF